MSVSLSLSFSSISFYLFISYNISFSLSLIYIFHTTNIYFLSLNSDISYSVFLPISLFVVLLKYLFDHLHVNIGKYVSAYRTACSSLPLPMLINFYCSRHFIHLWIYQPAFYIILHRPISRFISLYIRLSTLCHSAFILLLNSKFLSYSSNSLLTPSCVSLSHTNKPTLTPLGTYLPTNQLNGPVIILGGFFLLFVIFEFFLLLPMMNHLLERTNNN